MYFISRPYSVQNKYAPHTNNSRPPEGAPHSWKPLDYTLKREVITASNTNIGYALHSACALQIHVLNVAASNPLDEPSGVTVEARIRPWVSPYEIYCENSRTGTGFTPRSSKFFWQYHSTLSLHTHIWHGGWKIACWWLQFRDIALHIDMNDNKYPEWAIIVFHKHPQCEGDVKLPVVLNLGVVCRLMYSFVFRSFYLHGNNPRHPLYAQEGGCALGRSWRRGKGNDHCPFW
jgi:hypothetical protein